MKTLTDSDPMPWGKYKATPMQDVPASYLHWLWTNPKDPMKPKAKTDPVGEYIGRNLTALQQEHPDGIW